MPARRYCGLELCSLLVQRIGIRGELGLELLGQLAVLGLLELHRQPSALDGDRLAQVGLLRLVC